jgi:hypothetical protein
MKKLVLATAALAALAFTAPAFAYDGAAKMQLAQADVKVKIGEGRGEGRHEGMRHRDVKKVVIHRDRDRHEGWRRHEGRHEGWRHEGRRHHEGGKTVIIKKREG